MRDKRMGTRKENKLKDMWGIDSKCSMYLEYKKQKKE